MSCLQYDDYVLPKELRNSYFLLGPVSLLGLTAFSACMWYVTFTQDHSRFSCGSISFIFSIISILAAVSWIGNMSIIKMRYQRNNEIVSNLCGGEMNMLSLCSDFHAEIVSCRFTIGKGTTKIEFLLVSNSRLPDDFLSGMNGLKVVKAAWNAGIIILPGNIQLGVDL